ncbi:hypothetical protein CPAV1605_890 [seawater metagenome]|uniref:Uncharacterized protein n=1 Tax=seawater metagenome TaxID=1561972 RepID=A0A5E8CLP8_9ZZZZ
MSQSQLLALQPTTYFQWKKKEKFSANYYKGQCINIKGTDKKTYIITSAYGLPDNSKKIFQIVKNNDFKGIRKLKLVKTCLISGLHLLEVQNNRKLNNEVSKKLPDYRILEDNDIVNYNRNNFIKSLPKPDTNCYAFLQRSDRKELINLNIKSIIFESKDGGKNMPPIPYIECINNDDFMIRNLEGLTGSAVFNKSNKIIGIIESLNLENNSIKIIPSFLINKFMDSILIGYCTKIACLTLPYILTPEGLKILHTTKKIKKNDIITKINHKRINNEGKIYMPQLKCKVPLDTYILLTFNSTESVSLNIKREITNGKSYCHHLIRKKLKPISEILRVPNIKNEKFINLNGFIFCELTQPLLKWIYFNHNIMLKGKSMDVFYYKNLCFRGLKEVILIDYNAKNLSRSLKSNILEEIVPLFNLDYDGNQKEKKVYKVSKVNNKKIESIAHFQEILKTNKLNKIYLSNGSGKTYKILFD